MLDVTTVPNHNDTPTHSITEKELLVYNKAPSSVQDEYPPLQLCGHWVVGTSLEVPWPRGVSCGCVGITGSFGRRLSTGACDDEDEELVRTLRHHGLCTMTKGPGGCCTGIYWVSCQSSAMVEQQQHLPFSFRPALPHLMCSQRPK